MACRSLYAHDPTCIRHSELLVRSTNLHDAPAACIHPAGCYTLHTRWGVCLVTPLGQAVAVMPHCHSRRRSACVSAAPAPPVHPPSTAPAALQICAHSRAWSAHSTVLSNSGALQGHTPYAAPIQAYPCLTKHSPSPPPLLECHSPSVTAGATVASALCSLNPKERYRPYATWCCVWVGVLGVRGKAGSSRGGWRCCGL